MPRQARRRLQVRILAKSINLRDFHMAKTEWVAGDYYHDHTRTSVCQCGK